MKESETLYYFIHSLTKNEKRNFALEAASAGGKRSSGYLALYHWYSKQKSAANPKGADLKKMGLHTGSLAVQKNYLFHRLLESLLAHGENRAEMKIRILINKAELLYGKGFFEASMRLLDAAGEKAVACFSYHLQLDVLLAREAHLQRYEDIRMIAGLKERKKELLRIIGNIDDYQQISYSVFALTRHNDFMLRGPLRKKLDAIYRNTLLADEKRALSPIAKFHMYHTLCHYANIVQEPILAIRYGRRHLEIFDEEEPATRHELNYYITLLFNITVEMIHLHAVEHIDIARSRWKTLPSRFARSFTSRHETKWKFYDTELNLRDAYYQGNFSEIVKMLPAIRKQLTMPHPYAPIFQMNIAHYAAFGLYASGQPRQALKWLSETIDTEKTEYRGYRHLLKGIFLRLIIQYDLGREDVAESICRQLQSLIEKHDRPDFPVNSLPEVFLRLIRSNPGAERRKLLESADRNLLRSFVRTGTWSVAHELLFLCAWFRSAASGLSLQQTVPAVIMEFRIAMRENYLKPVQNGKKSG